MVMCSAVMVMCSAVMVVVLVSAALAVAVVVEVCLQFWLQL